MKYCSTILVGLLCTAACLAQTPLPESHRTSPEIFINPMPESSANCM